eukprot:5073305-Prymnesium_polylepis.1
MRDDEPQLEGVNARADGRADGRDSKQDSKGSAAAATALGDGARPTGGALERERDCLLGCLVAGFVSPAAQRDAVLTAAAWLPLRLSVPLLFLIGRGADACRRLQSSGAWERAATLATASLPAAERREVFVRWAAFLDGRGEPHRAVEVLMAAGEAGEVARRLLKLRA